MCRYYKTLRSTFFQVETEISDYEVTVVCINIRSIFGNIGIAAEKSVQLFAQSLVGELLTGY